MSDYYETRHLEIASYLLACECAFPEVRFTAGNRRATFRFFDPEGEIQWFVKSLDIPQADGGPWVSMPLFIEHCRQLKDAILRAAAKSRKT